MIINGNALSIPLADKSVHCIVTSPPYWGLRNYGVTGQLGLERTPEEYVANMVAVFRECWRVLRDDGSMWVNLGDSYASQGGGEPVQSINSKRNGGSNTMNSGNSRSAPIYLKPKDLVGIPWRVAFALQADGWYLRSDIIWSKPNPMPESVTDRPTKAHEYLFLLTKQERYFYDAEAVREESHTEKGLSWEERKELGPTKNAGVSWRQDVSIAYAGTLGNGISRNRRTVWTISTAPYKGAHFATYPPALVEPCIKAGTSERGVCPKCGKGWKRIIEHKRIRRDEIPVGDPRHRPSQYNGAYENINGKGDAGYAENTTTGWQPSCACNAGEPIPAIVFDPFAGSGTTVKVAFDLGRIGVGLDLSLEYLDKQATKRIHNGHTGRLI